MNNAFLKSYQTLAEIYGNKAFSSVALNKTLTFCNAKDKSLVTKIVYGVLDNDIKLEYQLSKYVKKMPSGSTLLFLKIGLYCLTELSIPVYAVVNDVAELSKISEDKRIVGFMNATLKNASRTARDFNDYPDEEEERISVVNSYPLWAFKKLVKDYGFDIAKKIAEFPAENRTVIRTANGFCAEKFVENGCELEKTVFEDAYLCKGKLPNLDASFTSQSLSSMAIARIAAASAEKSFLDCCAAPGGKTVYVKQLRPKVKAVACDVHSHREDLIKNYAARMGAYVETHCLDMTRYCEDFCGGFDTVLCDVPCSGFGVLNNRPDIKVFRQSKDISELMKLQYAILNNCKNYVKIGGTLVYSTCTVFDNENGQQIRRFLKENADFEYGRIVLPEFPSADGKPYYQFLPYKDGVQGFYVAVLKRTEQ